VSDDGDRRHGVTDVLGGAAIYPARAAARVWRGRLETAADEVLSAPEIARVIDRALAGPLPEQLTRSLVRHRVFERVVRELAEKGELDRLLDETLASDAVRRALERAASGPEIRAALGAQSTGLAQDVAAALRRGTDRLERRPRPPYASVAARGVALAVDAAAIAVLGGVAGALAGLVASLVGAIHPHWLAGALLGPAAAVLAGGYFTLFWTTAGQTPGMRLMHIRVRPRPGIGRSLLRTVGLALAIAFCLLGFLPALVDSRRRALQDYLARTVVVRAD
jgi:uncharacterized RDD family membrane protein YckC